MRQFEQIFTTILYGNKLYVISDKVRYSGRTLLKYFNENDIDIIDGTPTQLKMIAVEFNGEQWKIKKGIIGGEELDSIGNG